MCVGGGGVNHVQLANLAHGLNAFEFDSGLSYYTRLMSVSVLLQYQHRDQISKAQSIYVQ